MNTCWLVAIGMLGGFGVGCLHAQDSKPIAGSGRIGTVDVGTARAAAPVRRATTGASTSTATAAKPAAAAVKKSAVPVSAAPKPVTVALQREFDVTDVLPRTTPVRSTASSAVLEPGDAYRAAVTERKRRSTSTTPARAFRGPTRVRAVAVSTDDEAGSAARAIDDIDDSSPVLAREDTIDLDLSRIRERARLPASFDLDDASSDRIRTRARRVVRAPSRRELGRDIEGRADENADGVSLDDRGLAAFAAPRGPEGLSPAEIAALDGFDPSGNRIDEKLARRLREADDAGEATRALVQADLAWDRELSRFYRELRAQMKGDARRAIRDEQQDWLDEREEDHGPVGSSAARDGDPDPVRVLRRLERTRQRALELSGR